MESWAKSMNKKKETKKTTATPTTLLASTTSLATSSGFVEVKPQGFAPIERKEEEEERLIIDKDVMMPLPSTSNFKVLAQIRIRHVKIKLNNMFLKLNFVMISVY
jgi:hypothetical protein